MKNKKITIIGAGLAGCEAALQCASLGIKVNLIDMKPGEKSPAHKMDGFCELVCSNSLRAARVENAVGLLKYELVRLGSFLMEAAYHSQVPAGGALAVDRNIFSSKVTEMITCNPLITVEERKVTELPGKDETVIFATGPLTQGGLFDQFQNLLGQSHLHFFDAAAPIIESDSIDMGKVYALSRYGKGGSDYLNCPMNKEEYLNFYNALITAERAEVEDFDREIVFEGCMPVETMASRGEDTLRFGPLKPVGLENPETGVRPYAVVQLRQDDSLAHLYNMVGFQTRLKQGEQKRVFSLIPGLENAKFVRYGVMHRNTFIQSPKLLNADYSLRSNPNWYFAGQITGVEGYVESMASGYVAGLNAALSVLERDKIVFSEKTIIGSMAHYISNPAISNFQPMNANFGLVPPPETKVKKVNRNAYLVRRAATSLEEDALRIEREKGLPVNSFPEIPVPELERRKDENK